MLPKNIDVFQLTTQRTDMPMVEKIHQPLTLAKD